MPPPTSHSSVASLESRIRKLEADNASLSHAASEAASLVEEYAADAAAYRRSQPVDTALVTELTDAARRKDLRIQRLTSFLDAERARSAQMQEKLGELEEMLTLADEMEKTLRLSLDVVNKGSGQGFRSDGQNEGAQVWTLVLKGLRRCMPEGVFGEEFEGLDALKAGVDALNLAAQLTNNMSDGQFKWETDFTTVINSGCVAVERALRWCFMEPATRGAVVMAQVSNWRAKLEKVAAAVHSGEAIRWTDEFAHMKEGLLTMAVETLEGIVPKAYFAHVDTDLDALLRDVEDSWRRRADEVRRGLRVVKHDFGNGSDAITVQKKLDITQNTLARRTKELEDIKVRMQVFEGRLEKAVEEGKQLAACKQRVAELEALLSHEKAAATKSRNDDGSPDDHGGSRERNRATGNHGTNRHYEDIEVNKEATRLRRILVRRHLADLQSSALSTDMELLECLGKETDSRKSMRDTIENARLSASNASIVELDPDTLLPKAHKKSRQEEMITREGLPTNEILYNNREVNARDVRRQEITLGPSDQDYSSVISALRLSFTH